MSGAADAPPPPTTPVNQKCIIEMMTSVEQNDWRSLHFLTAHYRTREGVRALVPATELTRLLRFAVIRDAPECVRVLISCGADIGTRDFMNRTLLWQAAARSAALVDTLIRCETSQSSNVNRIDVNDLSSGEYGTALMAAAVAGQAENVRLLIAAGADVNAAALSTQETPLIAVAKRHGRASIARLLIDAGAHLNCVDATSATALHWAANRGFARLVRLLLLRGAATAPLNGRQETALAVAQRFRHEEIARWLVVHPRQQMRDLLVFLCLTLQPLELPVLLTLTIFDHAGRHLAEFAPSLHVQWEMAKRIKQYKRTQ
jgi:hypothetical protein